MKRPRKPAVPKYRPGMTDAERAAWADAATRRLYAEAARCPANRQLRRIAGLLAEVVAIAGPWLKAHGLGCGGCAFCSAKKDAIADVTWDVAAILRAARTAIDALDPINSGGSLSTPEEKARRLDEARREVRRIAPKGKSGRG